MCGRTSLTVTAAELEARFGVDIAFDWSPRYNIAPGQNHPAIVDTAPETLDALHWGLIPAWADDTTIGNRMINARAETVDQKRSFKNAFENQRCLVVVDGFYEWKQLPGGKQPYRIVRKDREAFAMAGLWERWEGNDKTVRSLTVITTEPNEVVEPIHNRMPVIFEPNIEREWLSASPTDAKSLLEPINGGAMEAYPVSTAVNNPQHDTSSVLEKAQAFDQPGLDDFGS